MSALSVLVESPGAWEHPAHLFKLCGAAFSRVRLPSPLLKLRFGIEGVHLTRPTIHVQEDHASSLGRMVFHPKTISVGDSIDAARESVFRQQSGKNRTGQSRGTTGEHVTSGDGSSPKFSAVGHVSNSGTERLWR